MAATFLAVGHRPLTSSSAIDGTLAAVLGTGAAVVAVVVGGTCLLRWRLVGDSVARDIGLAMTCAGVVWIFPLHVGARLLPEARNGWTWVTVIGASAAITAMAGAVPARRIASAASRVGAVLLAAAVAVPSALQAVSHDSTTLPPALVVGWSAVGIALLVQGVRLRSAIRTWAGLASVGLLLGEAFASRAASSDDLWHLARPLLSLIALTLGLIGAGMGLRDAYLDVRRSQEDADSARVLAETRVRLVSRAREEAAHDARSALLAIQGAVRLLEQQFGERASDIRLTSAVRAETDRLRALLGESDSADPQWFSLLELVEPLVTLREGDGQRVVVDVPQRLSVRAVAPVVGTIIQNLLDNALRHSEGAAVTVSGRARANGVGITVADRGPGVPARQRAVIFERGTTSHRDGQGLGLHIARQLARGLGGDLTYHDRSGGGAEFIVELPAEVRLDEAPGTSVANLPRPLAGPTVAPTGAFTWQHR